MRLEYLTVEWLWDSGSLRVNHPNKPENQSSGSYQEVVDLLTSLGNEGWEVCACVANTNWLFWTMKRGK